MPTALSKQALIPCEFCGRTFLPDRYVPRIHGPLISCNVLCSMFPVSFVSSSMSVQPGGTQPVLHGGQACAAVDLFTNTRCR